MTKDEVIEMARKAGLHLPYWNEDLDPKTDAPSGWTIVSPLGYLLEAFAKLIEERVKQTLTEETV